LTKIWEKFILEADENKFPDYARGKICEEAYNKLRRG